MTKFGGNLRLELLRGRPVDMNKYTIGLENRVNQTFGGIATDEFGRAVIGSWSRWFTGLYAAGDAACSGLNGAGALPGNRLLDA